MRIVDGWNEQEYFKQKQLRETELKRKAYTDGFERGAVWGMCKGVKLLSETFAKNADTMGDYPPELVKSFAAYVAVNAPSIKDVLLQGLSKDKEPQ